jgi:hypothetical protein
MTLSIMTLLTLQHNNEKTRQSILTFGAKCRYVECRHNSSVSVVYAQCCLFIVMPNVFMLSVVRMSVAAPQKHLLKQFLLHL